MRNIAIIMIILLFTAFGCSTSDASVVNGKLTKYISNADGSPVGGSEVIKYTYETCDVHDQSVGEVLGILLDLGDFSNLSQLEAQVNRVIKRRGCSRNFLIVDTYVDER